MIGIIGGGIIGLSIGWELVRAGAKVTILEKSHKGPHNATWASGGVIAAWSYEAPGIEPLVQLQQQSRDRWPAFAADLMTAADFDIDYIDNGLLHIALSEAELAELETLLAFHQKVGVPFERISGDEARKLEPNLTAEAIGGAFLADNHQLDNRLAAAALRRAFARSGGTLRTGVAVERIIVNSGRATGVVTDQGKFRFEQTVLTAGAWSGQIGGLPPEVMPPVFPYKGQMATVQMDAMRPLTYHKILGLETYLMPRSDGRLLIGATFEDVGFDTTVTAGGISTQLANGCRLMPAIHDLPITETWAGLRPGSPDGKPLLGKTAIDNLIFATGHQANGILLTPITAQAISHLVLTGETLAEITPFLPEG